VDFGFDGFDLKRERERGKESVVLEDVFSTHETEVE